MLFMELKPANNKNIYNIKFGQPHVRREVSQYSGCQQYGKKISHTKFVLPARKIDQVR